MNLNNNLNLNPFCAITPIYATSLSHCGRRYHVRMRDVCQCMMSV